ncbi:MAG TPA: glycosyltransferase [Streptosporangiaceae bacterium]
MEAGSSPPRSLVMPRRVIALTFDGGPDPRWTPQILAVLQRFGAHATFFETGAHAAQYPALSRTVLRDGNEIGTDTYTHADLGTAGWRRGPELTLAQNALAGAAGIHTRLLRLPYWPSQRTLDGPEWQALREAGREGYLVAFADRDTRDWSRARAGAIVARAMPHAHRGEIVTMQDGGTDGRHTVAVLSRLLKRLRGRGYRFTTITGGLGMPSADVPATARQRDTGGALLLALRISADVVTVLTLLLVITAVLAALRLLVLVAYASYHRRRMRRGARVPQYPAFTGPVSVIVPAYNEATGITATVMSLCDAHYLSEVEIIVVDDGSTDMTAAIAHSLAVPGVRVVSQPNLGKSAALNTGIALASHDIVVLVDGDTVFEKFALARLVAPFGDPGIAAVSGNTKVGNRRGILGRWQHIEYVIGFNLDRRMFDVIGYMPTVPGAIGAFDREVLRRLGGLSDDTLAEDTDLTMTVCRAGYRTAYVEDARAWTEAPGSLRQLWRQRYRWSYGTLQAMWKHRGALVEGGRSGKFGRRCLTYLLVFQVALPLVAPAIDVSAIYGLLVMDPARAVGIWLAFTALQMATALYAFRLDRERLRPLWALPLQQVVYRQLMYLVCIQSVVTALYGVRVRWRPVRRAGTFSGAPGLGRPPGGRPGTVALARPAAADRYRGPPRHIEFTDVQLTSQVQWGPFRTPIARHARDHPVSTSRRS